MPEAIYLSVHPTHPQKRLLQQAIEIIRSGGVAVYPTDSCYALGCHVGDKDAMLRMRRLRGVDEQHNFTLMCRDLSEIATYAKVDNPEYRLLKALTPGAFTFILKATREVPRRLQHPKRKTIGIRIPDCVITQALLELLDEPLLSTTLILPDQDEPLESGEVVRDRLLKQVDLIIDGGVRDTTPTTVIHLDADEPYISRQGKGCADAFVRNDG